ncbi:FAD:protein FMN transferase [Zeaxanthinibacter enoshimensis]|uniref:FAD:protein FMN transferase n=1 Tax=Zeaxanthinibacter enoshimensis TaxID=392009 RepID=A0A4R6TLP0_9FLAO|nr:FAD:protein FMN transferase [Zeaxanthinibacter enoshimensis]TDQ30718.1 thiamine biosynthesis lipoprotein [Zeaxanthinibacter enoshimensis]
MKKLLSLFGCLFLLSCADDPGYTLNQNSGGALGTSYNIAYFTKEKLDLQREIDSVFKVINQSMSTYQRDSDISRINAGDSTVVVDQMFREVFSLSKEVYEATGGAFDPTVGILVNAWGFGPGKAMELDSTEVDSLMQYVGFGKVALKDDNTIYKQDEQIYFDFNAIAKGYAIDRLALVLDQKGISDYLVEVGGEIVARGRNINKDKPWVVGIDDPQVTGERALKKAVALTDRALASSGNYRKFRVDSVSGKKFVHTIDPKTGFTKDSNVLAATVIAENCATADAYATALMAMELENSKMLLEGQDGLEAYIIYLDKNGDTREFMTPGFREIVVEL